MKKWKNKIGNRAWCINTAFSPRKIAVLAVLGFCSTIVRGQSALPVGEARGLALGGATCSVRDDPWAVFSNPALLPSGKGGIVVTWHPSPFGMGELGRGGIAVSHGFSSIRVGAGIVTEGSGEYRDLASGLSVSVDGPEGLRVGTTLTWDYLALGRYGSAGRFDLDLGAAASIDDRVTLGVLWTHVTGGLFQGAEPERRGSRIVLGVGYRDELILVAMDVEKGVRIDPVFRLGVEVYALDAVTVRFGNRTEPAALSMGLGITTSLCRLDYACVTHPELPWSHAVTVIVPF